MARPLTVTAFGNAQVDTADKKAGTGSLLLDGADDYLAISQPNGELNVDNGLNPGLSYTVECWAKIDTTNEQSHAVISSRGAGAYSSFILSLTYDNTPSETRISFITSISASSATLQVIEPTIDWSVWNHFAATSNGTTITLWLNGVSIQSTSSTVGLSSLNSSQLPNQVYIGQDNITAGVADFKGWIDEVKISNVCRYTTTFTPLYALGTDGSTLVHLKMDGTDGSTTFEDDLGITGSSSLSAAFNIDRADGRTFLRANANLEAFATELAVQNPAPSMVYLQNDVYTWDSTDTWNTIYDSDDKWAVWERLNASFSLSAIGGDFDVASSQQFGEFTLSASAGYLRNAQANLSGAFTQTSKGGFLIGIDDPYDYTWDTIPEDQWNSFFTDQWRPDGWFAFDAVTLTANGGLALVGASTLEANSTVAVDARLSDVRASADLNSQFTLASGSDNSKSGSATLEAFAAEVTVARLSDVRASAELVSQFTLTSGSDNSKDGSSILFAEATLTSTSGVTLVNAATLDSQFALESQSRILKLANLDITSLGDLSVSGSMTFNAVSGLEGAFTQTASAGYSLSGSANLIAEFTEIVRPTLIPSVQLDEVAFNADLTASGQMTYGAAAQLEAFAAEIAVGQRIQGAKANLEAEFTSIVAGTATLAGQARLDAFVSQLSAGRISTTRGSATLAGTFAAEFAGELKLLDSQFIYMVLNENRTFSIESEIRKYDVLPENRLFGIDPESRLYQVLPENRTVDVGYFMQ